MITYIKTKEELTTYLDSMWLRDTTTILFNPRNNQVMFGNEHSYIEATINIEELYPHMNIDHILNFIKNHFVELDENYYK